MQADERAVLGYHAWQVYYRTTLGEVVLPTGYSTAHPVPVQEWLTNHRNDAVQGGALRGMRGDVDWPGLQGQLGRLGPVPAPSAVFSAHLTDGERIVGIACPEGLLH